MRLEDLKKRLSAALANAREVDTEFAKGVACAYDVILSILGDAEGVIQWHPYPQDKPKDGVTEYLISVAPEGGDPFVICSEWQNGYWGGFKNKDGSVTAWAEFPIPFKGGSSDES